MQVHVKLYGVLRQHLPREQRGKATLDLAEGAVVRDLLDQLGIDHAVLVAVNDEQESDLQHVLQAGDRIMVFELAAGG